MIKYFRLIIVLICIYFLNYFSVFAQHELLIKKAKAEVRQNEIVLNPFFVCLSKSWNYVNSVRYSFILTKNIKYRFIIKNSDEYEGKAVVRIRYLCDIKSINYLRKKANEPEGHFYKDIFGDSNYLTSFEFEPKENGGIYQIFISFTNGKEGCAVVLLVYEK